MPDVREQALKTIKADSRLLTLARTPFLLAMMCATPEVLGNRATQRANLFEACTRYLLKQLDWQDLAVGRPRTTPDEWSLLEQALKVIAVRFFKLDVREAFREEEILFLIRNMVCPANGMEAREILEEIIRYSGLLQRVGSSIDFVHRSIWEFYVAQGMRDEPLENLLKRATIPTWEEPIRLFVGLTPDVHLSDLLRQLWDQNKGLALRSMMELAEFPQPILTELVNNLKREDRVRLIAELEDNLSTIVSSLDKVRTLLDTSAALFRVERDCEVLCRCVGLLEAFAVQFDSAECREAVNKVLDLPGSAKRLEKYSSSSEFHLDLVRIPAGQFTMGSDDEGRTLDEKPAHSVQLSEFYIGKYQVVNKLYYADFPFAQDRRDARSNQEDQPVIFVTWYEAYIFARWLGCDLPTEAEWEYACRSGGKDDGELFDFSRIRDYAWYVDNSANATHSVGKLAVNSFGVHDMLGNVREWCADWFDGDYYKLCQSQGVVKNPNGPKSGTRKAIRGGCFDWNVANLVPTYRNYNPPDNSYYANGFRLVLRGQPASMVVTEDR